MSNETNIFISWSGDKSHQVAEKLRDWLPLVIEGPKLWLSSRYLPDGKRWSTEIAQKLEISDFGILVITPMNIDSPWLSFEAGALSKDLRDGRVIPFLVGLSKEKMKGPLSQFQAITSDSNGTLRLIKAINNTKKPPSEEEIIKKRFNAFWPALESFLSNITSQLEYADKKDKNIKPKADFDNIDIKKLHGELSEAKDLIRQLIDNWGQTVPVAVKEGSSPTNNLLKSLEGAWVDYGDDTHLYLKTIQGKFVAPYCYGGNTKLDAEYYDWKRAGEYWIGQFRWFRVNIKGVASFKLSDENTLEGEWWYESDLDLSILDIDNISKENLMRGTSMKFVRNESGTFPEWAKEYFKKVEFQG